MKLVYPSTKLFKNLRKFIINNPNGVKKKQIQKDIAVKSWTYWIFWYVIGKAESTLKYLVQKKKNNVWKSYKQENIHVNEAQTLLICFYSQSNKKLQNKMI